MALSERINAGEAKTGVNIENVDGSVGELIVYGVLYGSDTEGYFGGRQNIVQTDGVISVLDGGKAYEVKVNESGVLQVNNGYAYNVFSERSEIVSSNDYQMKVSVAGSGVIENITLSGSWLVDQSGRVTDFCNAYLEVGGDGKVVDGEFTFTTVHTEGGTLESVAFKSGSVLEVGAGTVIKDAKIFSGAKLHYTIGAGSKMNASIVASVDGVEIEREKLAYGAALNGKTINDDSGVEQTFVLEDGGSVSNTKFEDNTSLIANAGKMSNVSLGVSYVKDIENVLMKIVGADVVATGINVYYCGTGNGFDTEISAGLVVENGTVRNVKVLGGAAYFNGGVTTNVTVAGSIAVSDDGNTTTIRGNTTAEINVGAIVTGITVQDGAKLTQTGGVANNVTISARSLPNWGGGVVYSVSNGEVNKVTLKTGTAGTFDDAIARMDVSGATKVTSATMNKNTELNVTGANAEVKDATVNQGGRMFVSRQATAVDTQVKKNGLLRVENGGVEVGADVFGGGSMVIQTGASSVEAKVKGGGIMTVAQGGFATGTEVAKGGKMDVQLTSGTYWAGTSAGVGFEYGMLNPDTGAAGMMNVSAFTATTTRKGTAYKAKVDNVLVDKGGEFLVREDAKLNNVAVNANGTLIVNGGNVAGKLSGANDTSAELTDIRIYKNGKIEFTAGVVNAADGSVTTQRAYATAVGTSNYVGFSYGAILEDITVDKLHTFTVTQNGIARNVNVVSGGKLSVTAAIVETLKDSVDGNEIVERKLEGGTIDGLTVNKGATVYVYDGAKLTGDIVLNNKITAINAEINFNLVGKDMFNNNWCVSNYANLNGSGLSYTVDLAFNQAAGEYKLASNAKTFNGTVRMLVNSTSSGQSSANIFVDLKLGETYYHEETNRFVTLKKVNGDLWLEVKYDESTPNHNLTLAELNKSGDVLFIGVGNGELTGDTRIYTNDKLNVTFKIKNDSKVDYERKDFNSKYVLTIVNQLTGEVVKTVTGDLVDIEAGDTTGAYYLTAGDTATMGAGIYDVTLTLKNNMGVYETVRDTITVMDENNDLYFNTQFDTVDRYQDNGDNALAGAYEGDKVIRTILLGELNAGIYSFGNMVFDEDFTGTVTLLNEDLKSEIKVSVKNGVANLAGAVLEEGSYAIQIQGNTETDYEFQLVDGEVFENYSSSIIVNNGTWVDAHHFVNKVTKVGEPLLDDLNLRTVIGARIGASGASGDIILKVGDAVAVKAIEFVGNESGNNLYTFGVSGVGGDDTLKFSLISVTDGSKVKTIKSVTLNADGTLGDAIKIEQKDNVDYYLVVESLNADKGVESGLHLWVDTDMTLSKKANNADDVMIGANWFSDMLKPERPINKPVATVTSQTAVISDWVGSTDSSDWFALVISDHGLAELTDAEGNVTQVNVGKTGKYTFSIDNLDVENGTSFTVYRSYFDGKGYADSVNGATSAVVKVAGASNEAETKAVDLLAGVYYIQVTNKNSKNDLKDTEYSVNINLQDERKELFTLNDTSDSLAMNTADEYFFFLDDYADITFSSVKGMTFFQDNDKNGMKKITVKAGETVTLGAGFYYINTTDKCDVIGIKAEATKFEHGTVSFLNNTWVDATEITLTDMKFTTVDTSNDIIKKPAAGDIVNADGNPVDANGNIIYETVTPDAWVGYGDAADYYELNVTGATAGKYTFTLDGFVAGNVKMTVYRTQVDKNGVESLVKVSATNGTSKAIILNDVLDGTYYVAVESTKVGNTPETSKNSDYILNIDGVAYAQLDKTVVDEAAGTETLVGEKIASGSYGTFTLTEKSLVALTSTDNITGVSIYYNNGKGGFQTVTVTNNMAVLDAGTYYVKANCKEAIKAEKTVITNEGTDVNFSVSGVDPTTGARKLVIKGVGGALDSDQINGWVGLNAAEDAFIFKSSGDNAYGYTELSLTVNAAETLMAAKTAVEFSVYQNTGTDEKPVWKLVGSSEYVANGKDNTITVGFDMRSDAEYMFVVSTSDNGKGTCNVDYTISGNIFNDKLSNKEIGVVNTAPVQDSAEYTMSATVKNGYAVLVVNSLSALDLAKGYKLYSANGAGELTEVKLYGKTGTEAVVGEGIYYIAGGNGDKQLGSIEEITNPALEAITFDPAQAAANKSTMNMESEEVAGINGWVGVTNATDDYLFSTYSDGNAAAGWVNFELSSVTDQFNNGAKISMTLYENVNGVWKKVSGITTTAGTKLTGNSFGASLDDDTEYKLSIESGDQGKGSANLSYELDGTLDYYDLDNNSILTASRLVMDTVTDPDSTIDTSTKTWDATVTKAGDNVDFYDVNDLSNLHLTVEKGGSVKVTWYDENFNAVKANGTSLTISGSSASVLSTSAAFEDVRYVKVEAVGAANNHYTLTSTTK